MTTTENEVEETIDVIGIAKTLWQGRKTLALTLGICTLLGVFAALFTPKEYNVSTIMVPQVAGKSTTGLSSLASLAGIDLGMNQSAELSPVLYPRIVNSTPFRLELMNTPLHFKDQPKPVSIFDYYTLYNKPTVFSTLKKYTLGLPQVLIGLLKKEKDDSSTTTGDSTALIRLTEVQDKMLTTIGGLVTMSIDKQDGFLTLSVTMPEALAAAELAKKAQTLLQEEVIQFKIEKSMSDLDFIQKRYNVAKAEAEGFQVNMAENTDRYKNLTSSVPQVSNTRLQTKYTVANNVYQELAKQLEQAKIQVSKDTPVFTILEPVTVPVNDSGPGGLKILLIWMGVGCFLGIGILYVKRFWASLKLKWQEA